MTETSQGLNILIIESFVGCLFCFPPKSPKHMLSVLKRTVSIEGSFEHPIQMLKLMGKKIFTIVKLIFFCETIPSTCTYKSKCLNFHNFTLKYFGLSAHDSPYHMLLILFYFRPVGRKSLEKLQRSTGGKSMMSVKVGQSMSFDPDIPENNTSKLANKFIPMQLRTQPSNLGMGQLQRVNTTLLGEISPGIAVETY